MKKILSGLMLFVGTTHFSHAQVDAGQNATAIGLGASSTDPVYKFTYQNNLIAHYGIGWFSDTQFVGAPMGYFGGYGGLKFFTEGQPRLYIDATGNIGIGTTTPAYKLDMLGGNISITNNGNNPQYRVVDGSIITKLQSQTVGGTAGAVGTESANDLAILTGNITRMFIQNNTGNVLIGKTSQVNPAYMLDVAGNIRSNQVVVNTTGADFVFDPAYRLNPLSSLKRYIDRNHHLPAIPPATEMQKNGLNVGDNQVKLLQKVEELTLYLIKKDNEIKKLEKRLEALEKNNAKKKR